MAIIQKHHDQRQDEERSNLDLFSLEMFENIAYTMAKHADPAIPDDVEEWLDGFNMFSIYQVLPELIKLWGLNVKTDAEAKKTSANRAGDDYAAVSASVCAAWDFYGGYGAFVYWVGE